MPTNPALFLVLATRRLAASSVDVTNCPTVSFSVTTCSFPGKTIPLLIIPRRPWVVEESTTTGSGHAGRAEPWGTTRARSACRFWRGGGVAASLTGLAVRSRRGHIGASVRRHGSHTRAAWNGELSTAVSFPLVFGFGLSLCLPLHVRGSVRSSA